MHDPLTPTPRERLNDRQRLQMFIDAGGICCLCGTKIDGVREMWDEHLTALWAGGSNKMWNRGPEMSAAPAPRPAKRQLSAAVSESSPSGTTGRRNRNGQWQVQKQAGGNTISTEVGLADEPELNVS